MYDYKIIFDSLWDRPFVAMAVTDISGVIKRANGGFDRLIGKQKEEVLDLKITDLFSDVFNPVFQNEPGQIRSEKRFSSHENVRIWNGYRKSLEIAIITISEDGDKLIEIKDNTDLQFACNRYISENKKLNIALESINDGVITTNKNDKIILVNNAIERIFGIDRFEIIGKPIVDLFMMFEADYSVYAGKMQFSTIFGMAHNNSMIINDTVVITLNNGVKKSLLVSSTKMMDNVDMFNGFLYVVRDITEQIKIETQLNISRKMESIGQLAAGIAHEINTPMQYISDNISFLKDSFSSLKDYCNVYQNAIIDEELDNPCLLRLKEEYERIDVGYLMSEIPEAIAQARTGVEKVSKIVLAMKNFAHPGNKDKGYYDINASIKETSVISRNEYKYVADLQLELEENLPAVYCLLDEINQVILNMVINSAHAIREKVDAGIYEKGIIKISTKENNNFVQIIIYDSGMGIKAEVIDKIFDPFFTTKEVGKGTGQGLSIAHNIIVQQHKGSIHVESEPGEYARFIISLPIKEEDNE